MDALVEGTHFRSGWLTSYQLGRKAFLVNASDIAAMGGRPCYALAALEVPPTLDQKNLAQLEKGIADAARECGAVIVGGNLTRSSHLSISITLIGAAARHSITRSGARPGDSIFVTGSLGDAAAAVQWLGSERSEKKPAAELRRFAEPEPRLEVGRTLADRRLATAMIDISDGLLQDLEHLCRASHCSAEIYVDRVPCRPKLAGRFQTVLAGGEDYELLFTVSARQRLALSKVQHTLPCPITQIGTITAPKKHEGAARLLRDDGSELQLPTGGFDHFRRRSPKGKP